MGDRCSLVGAMHTYVNIHSWLSFKDTTFERHANDTIGVTTFWILLPRSKEINVNFLQYNLVSNVSTYVSKRDNAVIRVMKSPCNGI